MDGRNIKKATVILVMIVFMASFISVVDGEEEPNDSMDDPNVIGEGNTTGRLDSGSSYSSNDEDMFRVNIPVNSIVFFSLKKTDTGSGDIYLKTFGSDRESIYLSHYSSPSVDVAGEVTRGILVNHGPADHFFLIVTGRGEYSINIKYHDMDDPEDAPGSEESPMLVSEGKKLSGKVFKVTYDHQDYEDVDSFYINVASDCTVKATVKRTDDGDGTIYASLNDYSRYSSVDIKLDEKDESETTSVRIYNYGGNDESVYLDIWGEGEYEIIFEVNRGLESEVFLFSMIGAVLCISLMTTLLPVAIVIVMIIVIVKSTKKGDKKKKIGKRE